MGSFPTLQLQVAPGYSPTQVIPSGAWVDITGLLRTANPKRGRQRQLDDFSTGTMPLSLDNSDRLLDPLDPASPYFSGLKPGMPARLQAVWSGTTYPVWFGFVDGFGLDWPGNREAAMTLPCSDVFGQLAVKKINDAGYARLVLSGGPGGYWRMGDAVGATAAADSSGNGHDAPVNGTVYFGWPSVLMTDADTACSTGIREGHFTPPSGASITGAGAFTVELWAQIGAPPVSGSSYLISQADATRSSDVLSIAIHTAGTALNGVVRIFAGDTVNSIILDGTTLIGDDETWHHIVVTRAADGVTYKIYVDGVLEATGTATGVVTFTAQQLAFAAGWFASGPLEARLDGAIDEVAIYPRALSATEIADHYNTGAVPWDSQTTGERIHAIADVVGVPTGARNIDAGTIFLAGVTQPLTGQFALPYMQTVSKCEIGRLFVAADGRLTFHDTNHDPAHTTSLVTLTDADPTSGALGSTALPYQPGGVKLQWDLTEVASEVQVTRAGGVTQIAKDPRDPPPYGNRSLELSDLPLRSDQQASNLAAALLDLRKDPKWRLPPLVLDGRARSALWPQLLGREIGDMITVLRRVPGLTYTLVGRIEGIEHNIDAQARTWKTTWTVALLAA